MNETYLDSIIYAANKLKEAFEEGKSLNEYTQELSEIDSALHSILDDVEDEQA